MKLVSLGILFTMPAFMFAQLPDGNQTKTPKDSDFDSGPTSTSSASGFDPLTPQEKVKRRALRLVEPVTLLSSAFGAGIDQWRDTPPEWGQGSEAFAIRFASAEGFTAAHNGIALGFDLAFHLDPRYHRLPGAGIGPRIWNAVSQTFIANKDSGGKTVNVSEIAGNLGAGFVSNTWQPPGYNNAAEGLERGLMGLAYHSAKNVLREFLPDILHPAQRGATSRNGP